MTTTTTTPKTRLSLEERKAKYEAAIVAQRDRAAYRSAKAKGFTLWAMAYKADPRRDETAAHGAKLALATSKAVTSGKAAEAALTKAEGKLSRLRDQLASQAQKAQDAKLSPEERKAAQKARAAARKAELEAALAMYREAQAKAKAQAEVAA